MGCISSKLLATADLDDVILFHAHNAAAAAIDTATATVGKGNCPNHVVSLTSSTYGVLNLDHPEASTKGGGGGGTIVPKLWKRSPPAPVVPQLKKMLAKEESPEIINAWELMEDLDDDMPIWSPARKPTKTSIPMQLLVSAKVMMSPKVQKKKLASGKENSSPLPGSERSTPDPNRVLKPYSPSVNTLMSKPNSNNQKKKLSPIDFKSPKIGKDGRGSSSRRSLSPLFDPELLDSLERELCQEGEQIKKMVDPKPRTRKARDDDASSLLQSYEEKCPIGGEKAVVLYTTTLRGIRKTFEECNAVRSLFESYDVQILERDISMDSGFREELRVLLGRKDVRVPVVFVKGRLVGGAEEVSRLDEEGRLGLLLEGIPRAGVWCEGCGGVRFVMCMECSGSCKVLDEEEKKMVKCGECNENGLIHCPLCC